jgi:hypothetical protein
MHIGENLPPGSHSLPRSSKNLSEGLHGSPGRGSRALTLMCSRERWGPLQRHKPGSGMVDRSNPLTPHRNATKSAVPPKCRRGILLCDQPPGMSWRASAYEYGPVRRSPSMVTSMQVPFQPRSGSPA